MSFKARRVDAANGAAVQPFSWEPTTASPVQASRAVDMAQEFTQMILAQRGYQANGKMITVSDQLLMDTINLKQ